MDETDITLRTFATQTVVGTSSNNLTYVQNPENHELVSFIEAVSAKGPRIGDIVVFEAESLQKTWFQVDNKPDTFYTTSEVDWNSNSISLHQSRYVFSPKVSTATNTAYLSLMDITASRRPVVLLMYLLV